MTLTMMVFLILGGIAGGFINGLAGMGTALFALGFFLVVLDPIPAVAMVALMSVVSGFQGLWVVRDAMVTHRARLFRFLIPGVIGVPVGTALLAYLDAQTLKYAIAGTLIAYGGYFGFRSALPAFDRSVPRVDAGIGFIGGILGGIAAMSGALPTIWLSLRPWPKSETRAVLQPYNFILLFLTGGLLWTQGGYADLSWTMIALVLAASLVAAQVGVQIYRRLSDDRFRRILILMTLTLGIGVLISEVF